MSAELTPPRKTTELEDSGTKDIAESSSDEHFSDASEGRAPPSTRNEPMSPIPITRVERVDDEPSHGEVPGTDAWKKRTQDAVPDEVEIVPDGQRSRSTSRVSISDRPVTPGGTPIPKTVVEKIDPDEAHHGDIPGTEAHQMRLADAAPDVIIKAPETSQSDGQGSPTASIDRSPLNDVDDNNDADTDDEDETENNKSSKIIPESAISNNNENDDEKNSELMNTVSDSTAEGDHESKDDENQKLAHTVTSEDEPNDTNDKPVENDVEDNNAFRGTRSDTLIDDEFAASPQEKIDKPADDPIDELADGPTDEPVNALAYEPSEPADDAEAEDDDGFGDFDEFEEGGEGDDDFGDFDDGFQQGESDETESAFDKPPDQAPVPAPPTGPPVLDFAQLTSPEEVSAATQSYVNEIYPGLQDVPSISPGGEARSIFLSERSQSLWTQLVAPPPLQPPDWVRSRIRRLFLVSLGVPVDLDEILPASKQKKLILPSINIAGDKSPRASSDNRGGNSNNALDRVKRDNASSTSVDSNSKNNNSKAEQQRSSSTARKGPPPPPELDLGATSMLCSTTEAALRNLTDAELAAHVEQLKALQVRANEVFEYWQKRMESALGDKDAFEQVIESMVAHAKKLR